MPHRTRLFACANDLNESRRGGARHLCHGRGGTFTLFLQLTRELLAVGAA